MLFFSWPAGSNDQPQAEELTVWPLQALVGKDGSTAWFSFFLLTFSPFYLFPFIISCLYATPLSRQVWDSTQLGARTLLVTSASLLVTSALLVVTRTLLGAPGIATRSKDATRTPSPAATFSRSLKEAPCRSWPAHVQGRYLCFARWPTTHKTADSMFSGSLNKLG